MSIQTRNPVRFLGGQPYSGGPNTGEFVHVRGGSIRACLWSGGLAPSVGGCNSGAIVSGNNVLLWVGAGRLNSIVPHVQMVSGAQAWMYDSSAIGASGTSVSGLAVIGVLPTTYVGGQVSGVSPNSWPLVINLDVPFNSGLGVSVPSGAPGFTLTFTPEVVYAGVNP